MGEGDFMPIGGHKRYVDPKVAAQRAAALKKGAEEGDKIKKMAKEYKKNVDLPAAEKTLEDFYDNAA